MINPHKAKTGEKIMNGDEKLAQLEKSKQNVDLTGDGYNLSHDNET